MKLLLALILSVAYLFGADAFVSSNFLKKHLDDTNIVIIDTTDKATFAKGHIPKAVQVEISKFRHQVGKYQLMNSSKEIEQVARELGINNDSYVVIYGHNQEKELLKSSYIALALIANGFTNVSLLNGGYGEWSYECEDTVSKETYTPKTGNFVAKFNPNILVDKEYVKAHINKTPMIEARPLTYFNGSKQSKGVKRLGHITGAQSSFWKEKFNADETLISDKKLNEIFFDGHKLDANKEVIAYCTGGLEASANWYILSQYMHFKDVKIYDASMKEWGNIDNTPMQK